MKNLVVPLCHVSNGFTRIMDFCSMFFALGIRFYLAWIFLWSGWLKIISWQSTLSLFEYEFQVPVLSPVVAAYLGTAAELIFPSLMLIGLGARIPAFGLLATNLLMLFSYPILFTPQGVCMVKDHYLWILANAVILFYGHGKISLDYILKKRVCKEYEY